uniref:Granulin a n=1 Tax=Oryzias latipes TaxID=8090 RepID=A0A3P9HE18_ORYLA
QMQKWVVICWVSLALVGADMCPNGGKCEKGQTCCQSPSKDYDCCPFDEVNRISFFYCYNVVIVPALFYLWRTFSCPDGKHCCPEGHQCSLDSQSIKTVLCKDGVSECPDETTCCETQEGKWACCPMPKAVCCDDKIHCCPEETTCDVEQMKCLSSSDKALPMWAKFPARTRADWENQKGFSCFSGRIICVICCRGSLRDLDQFCFLIFEAKNVPCDETAACPDQTTCCKTQEGGWACCPLPEAVCCEDFIHCCPKGQTCNLAAQTCEGDGGSVPMLEKVPSFSKVSVKMEDVPCDGSTSCPDQTTCCKTQEGGWACCPLPEVQMWFSSHFRGLNILGSCSRVRDDQSVRSADRLEWRPLLCDRYVFWACPTGRRPLGRPKTPWSVYNSWRMWERLWSTPKELEEVTGEREAVCCEDFIHCCPKGKTCNLAAQTCEGDGGSVPMLEKVPSFSKVSVKMEDVPCDGSTSCPDQTTCCKTQEGGWACCPLPEAVCCEDFIHCCPKGKTCNLAAQTCEGDGGSVPILEKVPSFSNLSVKMEDVPCDGSTSCPDQTTCCKTQEGGWACCPLPEAMCCRDMKHCCPDGYRCTKGGSCIKNTGRHWLNWHTFFTNKRKAIIV